MTPRTKRQFDLEKFKTRFAETSARGSDLLAYLERSHCGVWRCKQDDSDSRRWWLNITLPSNVAEMFDAHLEIQLVYVEYDEIEPRLLELIQREIAANARVDRGLFILASNDAEVDRLLRRRRGEFAAIPLQLDDLAVDSPDLRHRMSTVLTTVDHYDLTKPIHDPAGFFGRTEEFQQIISGIERGQSVGVFGLRKTGKTSLLNYVAGRRRGAGQPAVWVDISGLTDADAFRLQVLEKSWSRVDELGFSSGRPPRLRSLNERGELKVPLELLRIHWLEDLERIAVQAGQRIELFIDEIDQLYPDRSTFGAAADEFLLALTQLRGLIQSAAPDSGIVLICAGVDPAIFERPILASGADNLVYKLVRLMFLAPLTRDEMAEMVRDLGRRMGVRVRSHEVVDFLFAEYGGHALLTRKACSWATRSRQPDVIPWHMTLESVEEAATRKGEGSPYQQATEILESFGEWFPEEASLLQELWSNDPDERELGRLVLADEPQRMEHAKSYGLVVGPSPEPRIRSIARAVRAAD